VPKRLVSILVDMEPVLWMMVDKYPENERQRIIDAAAELSTAISNCLA
jgi:hypothetical protein